MRITTTRVNQPPPQRFQSFRLAQDCWFSLFSFREHRWFFSPPSVSLEICFRVIVIPQYTLVLNICLWKSSWFLLSRVSSRNLYLVPLWLPQRSIDSQRSFSFHPTNPPGKIVGLPHPNLPFSVRQYRSRTTSKPPHTVQTQTWEPTWGQAFFISPGVKYL